MKKQSRILPAALILMLLAGTAACGNKDMDADDMADSRTEASQDAGETSREQETGSSVPNGSVPHGDDAGGINGTNHGTTGGNSTASESDTIIDDARDAADKTANGAGNAVEDAGNAAKNAADHAGDAAKNAADHAGDAVDEIIDGAGDVIRDAADGVSEGIKDMTGK